MSQRASTNRKRQKSSSENASDIQLHKKKKTTTTKCIASEYDTILVVGPDRSTKLHVHSVCLSSASKVFRTMFGPSCQEGRNLRPSSPKEIELPEDDGDAMSIICSVIHHQNSLLPKDRDMSPELVFNVAVAADKYDCSTALRFASSAWIMNRDGEVDDLDKGRLMAAAYLLDDASGFAHISFVLVTQFKGSYLSIADTGVGQHIPWKVFYYLEERRSCVAKKFVGMLWDEVKTRETGTFYTCNWIKNKNWKYLSHLDDCSLYGAPVLPINLMLNFAEKIEDAEFFKYPYNKECPFETSHDHPDFDPKKRVTKFKEEYKPRATLCLDCIRADRECKDRQPDCRVNHADVNSWDVDRTGVLYNFELAHLRPGT